MRISMSDGDSAQAAFNVDNFVDEIDRHERFSHVRITPPPAPLVTARAPRKAMANAQVTTH